MSSIIPEDIKDIEEARKWLHKRGYSIVLAEEELAKWEGPHDGDEDNEIEDIEEVEEDELTWDDEDDDEDEFEDDDDEDEEDK
tara:strand:- start:754 stop:1002 length:249 start_codon:yes stop_codon:yes gene_type:complete